jgi:hypothetical protein
MDRLTKTGIGLAVLGAATFGANAATQHDNQMYIAIAGVTAFNFVQTGYSITSGQPYGGTSASVSNSCAQAQITVKAGSKGSTSVAQWFKTQVGAGQTLVCDTKGTFPNDLNFAVQGTMTMTVGGKNITCDGVIVAQGNFATVNNWWMGSPTMKDAHVGPTGATVQTCKQGSLPIEVIFSPQTPCVNNFSIGFL